MYKLLIVDPEEYMLSCLWRETFGVECLGCGFQRSLVFVFQGNFRAAFDMYPAIFTLIIMFLFLIAHIKYSFKYGSKILLSLFIINVIIIITSYIIKHF